jgi:pyrimidine-nucleoside phosphorylase
VLADALVRVGEHAGKRVVALLTDMDAPLGRAVGNAVETREAFDVLTGGGPSDLLECTLRLGAEMLVLGGRAAEMGEARSKLVEAIASGRAARVAERMVEAQGGDPRVVTDPSRLEVATQEVIVAATADGFVTRVDALEIGLASVAMGAGRTRADQPVDHAVGILIEAKPGTRVSRGEPVARLRVRTLRAVDEIIERVRGAFGVGAHPPAVHDLVLRRVANANSTRARVTE